MLTKPTVNKDTKPTINGLKPIDFISFKLVDNPTAAIDILKKILAEDPTIFTNSVQKFSFCLLYTSPSPRD